MKQAILAALAMFTSAFAAPVTAGEAFPAEGKMLLGVNFWGSKGGVRMWHADKWDEASIEKDIAALAATGVEMMRVFPTWSEFQPLVMERKYQGAPALVLRDGSDEEIYDPLWLDPGAVRRFEKFCEIAGRYNDETHGIARHRMDVRAPVYAADRRKQKSHHRSGSRHVGGALRPCARAQVS